MLQQKCAECGEPFVPREAKQRFCTQTCRIEWFANERREAIRRYRERDHSSAEEQSA
jgi:uncharacterized OB-fold protein